jgi:hypothetical protein
VGSVIKNQINSSISVYCDDIILSSNSYEKLQEEVDLIMQAMIRANFEVNLEKSHYPNKSATLFNIVITNRNLYFTEERMRKFQIKSNSFFEFVLRSEVLKSLKFLDQMLAYISSINAVQGEQFEAWLYTNPIYKYYKQYVNKKDYRKWKVVRKEETRLETSIVSEPPPPQSKIEKLSSWLSSKINK